MGAKGLLSNPKYRQLKQHGEITTPTPDLRDLSPLPKPLGREASYLPSSVSSPIFQPKRPRKLPPLPTRTWAGTFAAAAPRPPQPGRRAASSPPPPETCPSRVLLGRRGGCPRGRGRGKGKGPREGALTLAVAAGARRGVERGRRGGRHGAGARLGSGQGLSAQHLTLPSRRRHPSARAVRELEGGKEGTRRRGGAAQRRSHPRGPSRAAPPAAPPRRLSARPPPHRCSPASRLSPAPGRPQPPGCPRLPPSRVPAGRARVFVACPGAPCVPAGVPRWRDAGHCSQAAHE